MTPAGIVQSYLDEVGAAVLSGDWDAYVCRVVLPFVLTTQAAIITVHTEKDLRAGFDDFHQTLRARRITDYVRLVESATMTPDRQMTGRYSSHLVAGDHRIIDPYTSDITLRLVGNLWRATAISNSLTNSRWPLLTPSVDHSIKGSEK